jgi:hypothetical protein
VKEIQEEQRARYGSDSEDEAPKEEAKDDKKEKK